MRIEHNEATKIAVVQELKFLLTHEDALEAVPSKVIDESIQYHQGDAVMDIPADCKLRMRTDIYYILKQYGHESRTDDVLRFLDRLPNEVALLAAANALRDASEKIPHPEARGWLEKRAYMLQGDHYV